MVKFSKQLELQLVPEWKSAFCDYWKLKKELNLIKFQDHHAVICNNIADTYHHDHYLTTSPSASPAGTSVPNSPFLPFANLVRRKPTSSSALKDVIQVHHFRCTGPQLEVYETKVLEPFSENEYEVTFFWSIDQELNKVNRFYGSKEDEFTHRLQILKKQLHNLINLCITFDGAQDHSCTSSYDRSPSSSSTTSSCLGVYGLRSKHSSSPSRKALLTRTNSQSSNSSKSPRSVEMEMMQDINSQLAGMAKNLRADEDFDEEIGYTSENFSNSCMSKSPSSISDSSGNFSSSGKSPIDFSFSTASPALTISALTQLLRTDVLIQAKKSSSRAPREDITITKRKMQCAKKMLRSAFVEFYRGLGLLRSFSSLNMLAFGKILKKYDKVTGRNASAAYLKAVERSRFNSSDSVALMMDEVEKLFTQYFAKDDHKKAMMLLRPVQQKVCHTITFFLGLFSGWSLAFLVAFIILLHFNDSKLGSSSLQQYAQPAYQLYSMLILILLHMFMYGWNVYSWRQVRTNYPFIFEFAPKTELRYREILLVCTSLTTVVVASMVCHLIVSLCVHPPFDPGYIPLATISVFLLLIFSPLNIFYRSSRLFFLKCMKHIILAPLYKVVMADFFLADQLTSQISALRHSEQVFCYYFGGHFLTKETDACGGPMYHQASYILSFLPYWWRLMQCMRRWIDESDRMHLANGGKYLSAMVAAGARLTYTFNPTMGWLVATVISSCIATVYQIYWDIVVDWGLLQPNSRNPWLRDQLMLKNRSIYFLSIAINVLLRVSWLQSVIHYHFGASNHELTEFLFAVLEVFRRGHWNFYRLENEHLNNVGKYRAVKTVPLPFRDEVVAEI